MKISRQLNGKKGSSERKTSDKIRRFPFMKENLNANIESPRTRKFDSILILSIQIIIFEF